MATKYITIPTTENDDSGLKISRPDSNNQWFYDVDGLGGVDTLSFDRLSSSEFDIYQDASGSIHVDSVSSASHMIYVTLKNVEQLKFSNGSTTVDLTTRFGTGEPNAAPTGASYSTTVNFGSSYLLKPSDFGFSDTDAGDALATIQVTGVLSAGLLLNGKNVAAGAKISAADINAGKLSFKPVSIAAESGFSFKVSDGVDWSAAEYTMDFDVVRTNHAPVLKKAVTKAVQVVEGKAVNFTLPKGTFADTDVGDTMTYRIDNLPSWLSLDSKTGKLSGKAAYDAAEGSELALTLTATDLEGASASTTIRLALVNQLKITGTASADSLIASVGNDVITGLGGNDILSGGIGNDTLSGGTGADTLTLGTGADIVVLDAVDVAGPDTVTDFVSGEDRIQLSAKLFPKLKGIKDLSNYLLTIDEANPQPQLANHYLLFNSATGMLSYDGDGNGAGVEKELVELTGLSSLNAADLFVGK